MGIPFSREWHHRGTRIPGRTGWPETDRTTRVGFPASYLYPRMGGHFQHTARPPRSPVEPVTSHPHRNSLDLPTCCKTATTSAPPKIGWASRRKHTPELHPHPQSRRPLGVRGPVNR